MLFFIKVLSHKSIVKRSSKQPDEQPTSPDAVDPTATICLDIMSYVLIINSHRAKQFWFASQLIPDLRCWPHLHPIYRPLVYENFERVFAAVSKPSPVLDNAIQNLVTVASQLLRSPEITEDIIFALQQLTRLNTDIQGFFAERICLGISRTLRRNAAFVRYFQIPSALVNACLTWNPSTTRAWALLLGLLRHGLQFPKYAKDCFDTLVFIVRPARLIAREPAGALTTEPARAQLFHDVYIAY